MNDMSVRRRRPNFAAIPYGLVDDETISPQAKTVYLVLDRHADYDNGSTFVGKERVARKCGFAKADSIDPYLKELRAKGWISWNRRWRRDTGKKSGDGRVVYEYSASPGKGFEPTTNLYTVHDWPTVPSAAGEPIPPTAGQGVPPVAGQPTPPTAGTNKNQVNENQVNENQGGATAPAADAASTPKDSKTEEHPLPQGWQPDNKLWARMRKKHPTLDLHAETQKFCDYWHTQAGARSRKKDWARSWQNWLNKASTPPKYTPKWQQASNYAEESLARLQQEGKVNNDPLPF